MLTLNTQYLTAAQRREAEYLAALSQLNEAQAAFVAQMDATGSADLSVVNVLQQRVANLTPDWQASAVTISEAHRRFDIPIPTLRAWAAAKRIRAHKRGNLWYVSLDDVQRIVDEKRA